MCIYHYNFSMNLSPEQDVQLLNMCLLLWVHYRTPFTFSRGEFKPPEPPSGSSGLSNVAFYIIYGISDDMFTISKNYSPRFKSNHCSMLVTLVSVYSSSARAKSNLDSSARARKSKYTSSYLGSLGMSSFGAVIMEST